MKTNSKNIVIYVRDSKNGKVIQLVKAINENGKKKYKRLSTGVAATERNLERYRVNAKDEWNRLVSEAKKDVTLSEFLPTALKIMAEDCDAKSTKDMEQKIRDYILPIFGSTSLREIEPADIEEWQMNLKDWKKANMTKRCKTLLSRIFDRAVVAKIRPYNPVTGTKPVKLKRGEKKVKEIYSKEEIGQMLSGSAGWLRIFIMFFVYMGMRPNEVIALRWQDVQWELEKLHIRFAINGGLLHTPKVGERLIDIHKVLFDELILHFEQSDSTWIFPTTFGTPYKESSSVNRRHFKPLLKSLGIRYRTMYTLKHSYATHSLMSGQKVIYVSKQLGHASVETTHKFYTKLVDSKKAKEYTDNNLVY